jgi:Tfp pilus assembly protein PilF
MSEKHTIQSVFANEHREKTVVLLLLGIYFAAEIIYSFLSDATWDDDCPTRYYNTVDAFNHPLNFIDIWNRPLFVLLFSIPVQISKHSIPLLMSGLTAAAAWALYRYSKISGIRNAFLIVPFLLFQAFVFGISRNAETEPLAVVLISFGLLNLARKKYLWFALLGGLLPLARLELTPLLLFWLAVLVREKQWKYCLVLMLPLFTWNAFGFFSSGDPLWLLHTAAGDGVNRYGTQSFGHYFRRYIYITGPVIFYFFFIGIVNGLISFRKDAFVLWQFICGFLLYVLISWKLSAGDAAGFLRNLIPLSPFAAVLALHGFNAWSDAFTGDIKEHVQRNRWIVIGASLLVTIGALAFFSQQLEDHHTLLEEKNYLPFLCIVVLSIVPVFAFIKIPVAASRFNAGAAAIVTGAVILFTLITENWNTNMSPEREVMQEVSDLCLESANEEVIYVNHIWFYWSNGLDKRDARFKPVTRQELSAAENGSLVVWDSHYSHRLAGDVQLDSMLVDTRFIELFRIRSSDNKFMTIVFRRVTDPATIMDSYEQALALFPSQAASVYVNRGIFRLHQLRDTLSSAADFDKALQLDGRNADAWFNKGITLFHYNEFEAAVEAFRTATTYNPHHSEAFYNQGVALGKLPGRQQDAIACYSSAIQINPYYLDAYRNRAHNNGQLGNVKAQIEDLTTLLDISPDDVDALLRRGIAYYQLKNQASALQDFDRAIALRPGLGIGYFYRGLIATAIGDKVKACANFGAAAQLGIADAQQFLKHCQ